MEYFVLETQEAVYFPRLKELFPNATFGDFPSDDLLALLGVKRIIQTPMPALSVTEKITPDGFEFSNNAYRTKWLVTPKTTEELNQIFLNSKRDALTKINFDDNKIYADVIGNKTTEYLDAAIEAKAFKDAGYPTGVDNDYGLVKSWADAKQWTMRQATDDIIAQEAAWKGAAKLIRDYRLKAKEEVKRVTTIEEIETAMAIWNTFVTQIRTQLGVS